MVQKMQNPALSKRWFLDVQWSDCPPDVEQVVRKLWRLRELGNVLIESPQGLLDLDGTECEDWSAEQKKWLKEPINTKPLVDYLENRGVGPHESVVIHWWL